MYLSIHIDFQKWGEETLHTNMYYVSNINLLNSFKYKPHINICISVWHVVDAKKYDAHVNKSITKLPSVSFWFILIN